jgi:hypothetical protein
MMVQALFQRSNRELLTWMWTLALMLSTTSKYVLMVDWLILISYSVLLRTKNRSLA